MVPCRPRSLGEGEVVVQGQVIAAKYRLLEPLGKGGMGSVWRAAHVELSTMSVAVKLMLPEIAAHPEALARFKREAEAATLLRSPHLVQVYDFGVDAGTPYIVMELLRGGEELSDRLARVGRLSLGEAAGLLEQVARGVGKAHDVGIVHRDLKPGNIYLEPDDDREVVKVFDFGIAKRMDGFGPSTMGLQTQSGAVLGTPFYMSPEQATGKREIDHRTDIWSFGVIAFECVTGSRPFERDNIGAVVVAICTEPIPLPSTRVRGPRALDEWFLRCIARDPGARFSSIREAAREFVGLAQAAESAVAGRPSGVSVPVSVAAPPVAPVLPQAGGAVPTVLLPTAGAAVSEGLQAPAVGVAMAVPARSAPAPNGSPVAAQSLGEPGPDSLFSTASTRRTSAPTQTSWFELMPRGRAVVVAIGALGVGVAGFVVGSGRWLRTGAVGSAVLAEPGLPAAGSAALAEPALPSALAEPALPSVELALPSAGSAPELRTVEPAASPSQAIAAPTASGSARPPPRPVATLARRAPVPPVAGRSTAAVRSEGSVKSNNWGID